MDEKAGSGQKSTLSRVHENCEAMVEKLRLRPQEVLSARDAWQGSDRQEVVEMGEEDTGKRRQPARNAKSRRARRERRFERDKHSGRPPRD